MHDKRVVEWVRAHGVEPTEVYALDLFLEGDQPTFVAHRYHTVNGHKHLHVQCPLPEGAADKQGGDVCRCDPLEVHVTMPFPSGVMTGLLTPERVR